MLGYCDLDNVLAMCLNGYYTGVTITFVYLVHDNYCTYTSYPGKFVDSSGVFGLVDKGVYRHRFNLRFRGNFHMTGLSLLGDFAGTSSQLWTLFGDLRYTGVGHLVNFARMDSSFTITSGGVFGAGLIGRVYTSFTNMDTTILGVGVFNASFSI